MIAQRGEILDAGLEFLARAVELRSSSSSPGAVFKNGKLIERPGEEEAGDQNVA